MNNTYRHRRAYALVVRTEFDIRIPTVFDTYTMYNIELILYIELKWKQEKKKKIYI